MERMGREQSLFDYIHVVNENVEIVKGEDEYKTYLNYPDHLKAKIEAHIIKLFDDYRAKIKDDDQALVFRNEGNKYFKKDNLREARTLFTRSLSIALVGGKAYALALANRSATALYDAHYEECVKDIDLCLNADYPDQLKPKIYIRKAKCFKKLNKIVEMKETLKELKDLLESGSIQFSTPVAADKHNNEIDELLKDIGTPEQSSQTDLLEFTPSIPQIDPNPNFLNASSSVALKYNKSEGRYVVAQKQIQAGDVLFVEKSYMFTALYSEKDMCHYCFTQFEYCIPCKQCSDLVYCSEKCRDLSWNVYHQWECAALQTGIFSMFRYAQLALLTIFKAAAGGFKTISTDVDADTISYGNKEDNYPYVYRLCNHFDKLSNNTIIDLCAVASAFICYVRTQTTFFTKLREDCNFATCTDKEIENKLAARLMRHCSQFGNNNAILMWVDDGQKMPDLLAIGIFPSFTMINHSCCNNTAYYFAEDTIVVRASKKIEVGEQIFTNYVSNTIFSDTPLDEKMLFFKCKCSRCITNRFTESALNSFICVKCKGIAVADKNMAKKRYSCICLDCNQEFILSANILANMHILDKYRDNFMKLMNTPYFTHNFENDLAKFYEVARCTYSPTHKVLTPFYHISFKFHLSNPERIDFSCIKTLVQNWRNYAQQICGQPSKEYTRYEYDILKSLYNAIRAQTVRDISQNSILSQLVSFTNQVYDESYTLGLWFPKFNHTIMTTLSEFNKAQKLFNIISTMNVPLKRIELELNKKYSPIRNDGRQLSFLFLHIRYYQYLKEDGVK